MNITILELRDYLLKPHMREHFIDNFEAHFISAQEAVKMPILGHFRVVGEPDHFVWLRGFSDMPTRLEGLTGFYSSSAWKKYGSLANEMLLAWDNVRLLRPLSNIADLTCGLDTDLVAADLAAGTISPWTGAIAIDIYQAIAGKRDELVDRFLAQAITACEQEAIQIRGYFVADMSANDFPRLPVIQDDNEFVVVTAYGGEEDYREKRRRISPVITEAVGGFLNTAPQSMLLRPALRSPVRYRHSELHAAKAG